MNVMFIIAVVSLALQFGTTAALLVLGQAPRWRRVRWFGAVAFTAGCYSTVDAVAALRAPGEPDITWSLRLNIFIATVHGAAWLLFTYAGRDGRWVSIPPWVRRTVMVAIAIVGLGSISGLVAAEQRELLTVPAFGVSYERPVLSPLGSVLGLVPFALLAIAMLGVWQERRRGVEGTTPVLIGFGLFLAAAIEELLVAAGRVSFIFLGDIGYVCVVVPVTLQLFRQFRDDADQLDLLTTHLADEVQRRTDERDEAREQMIEQQRLAALGRLAAGVGHEINNPLQYLRFTLEELREVAQRRDDTDALTMIGHSFEGVQRIGQVVEDLRTYARPSVVPAERLDVRDVVRAALRVGAPQMRRDVEVTTALDDVPPVHGHEGRLVQVVLNPLVNAMQAMHAQRDGRPRPARLEIATFTTEDGWASIEIRDSGPGFAADILTRLGEPYLTTRAGDGGSGLGLFVTRGIVEAHGGRMHFVNAQSGGAIVRIALPPAAGASAPRDDDHTDGVPGPASGGTRASTGIFDDQRMLTVLLVEDDAATLRALQRGLAVEGMQVVAFTDGLAALEWLAAQPPFAVDVVLTDLMMPLLPGWELAERLAVSHPHLRATLVVLTGGAATPEAEAFVRQERLLVLDKPIARDALARALRARVTAGPSGRGVET